MVSLSPHVIFKFDRWLCETTGHLLYAICSFVDHFVAIGDFKLELQYGNAQFGSKSSFVSPASLKFDRWHRKIIAHPLCATSSFVHHFVVIGEFKLELQPGNAPLGLDLAIFLSGVTLKFDKWPWKTIRTESMLLQALCIVHFVAISEFNLELPFVNADSCQIWRCIFWPVPSWN